MVDDDGSLVGGVITIEDNASYAEEWPALAYDSTADQFIVVWQNDNGLRVAGCLVDEDADPKVYGCFSDIGDDEGDDYYPDVAANPEATGTPSTDYRFLVVWSRDDDPDDYDALARFVPAGGTTPTDEPINLDTVTTLDDQPAVAYDATSDYFFVAVARSYGWLRGYRIDNIGDTINSYDITSSNSTKVYTGGPPGIAVHDGEFWVIWWWEDYTGSGTYDHVGARNMPPSSPSGGTVISIIGGPGRTRSDNGPPAIACNGSTRCLVVRVIDNFSVLGSDDIYAAFFFR